ncbi:MAG TPA: hypothetical protein VI299_08810 [Polyangiales bacterium]
MHKKIAMALLMLGACHHAGRGAGTLESPATLSHVHGANEKVTFAWSSGADPSSGKMQATLADGTLFEGTFLQVKQTLAFDDAAPYYDAWTSPGWGIGTPWYDGGETNFVTAYSGTTLAHMRSADGRRMRCKFVLRDPLSGFVSGAEGQCQLSDGEVVYDVVLARHAG